MKYSRAILFLGLSALPLAALAQTKDPQAQPKEKERPKHEIGIDAGVYIPTNSTIRGVYGTGLKVGISPVTRIRNDKWHWDGDLGLISDSNNGAKLLIVPVNVCYERAFGPESSENQPFIRFSAGLVYNDHRFDLNGVHVSNKTVGADGAVEVGTVLAKKWRLSARYNLFTKSDDFDFSGLVLTVQYAAFKY